MHALKREQYLAEEKKKESKEIKDMFDYQAKLAAEARQKEEAKKAQLRKIQEENLKTALTKKNLKVQEKVQDSLKEKALVDSGAFENKHQDTR